jgi:UDP-N-acetylglucosamine 2-epimerase
VETIYSGWNLLVGSETKRIVEEVRYKERKKWPPKKGGIFGHGKASEKIVRMIVGVP